MVVADVRKLRDELGCSIGELADALEVPIRTLIAWESGDEFPTKSGAEKLEAVRRAGPSAIVRRMHAPGPKPGLGVLAEPRLWAIVQKLAAHPELLDAVERVTDAYPDPPATDGSATKPRP